MNFQTGNPPARDVVSHERAEAASSIPIVSQPGLYGIKNKKM